MWPIGNICQAGGLNRLESLQYIRSKRGRSFNKMEKSSPSAKEWWISWGPPFAPCATDQLPNSLNEQFSQNKSWAASGGFYRATQLPSHHARWLPLGDSQGKPRADSASSRPRVNNSGNRIRKPSFSPKRMRHQVTCGALASSEPSRARKPEVRFVLMPPFSL
jgi:hypothetical protein